MEEAMYDVVAVNIQKGTIRMMGENKTYKNAEAIVRMAVMRRGVEEEFFATAPIGMYTGGDTWHGDEKGE